MTDDKLRAALDNLPQWAMVGPMNDRHMEVVRRGQYWSIVEVRAALAASGTDEPTCDGCGASVLSLRHFQGCPAVPAIDTTLLREAVALLTLTPSGTVGPDEVPWFKHCGISHGDDRPDCVACKWLARALAASATDEPECEHGIPAAECRVVGCAG